MASKRDYSTLRMKATRTESLFSGVRWFIGELGRVWKGERCEVRPNGRWRRITNSVHLKEWTGYGVDVVLESPSVLGRKWSVYAVLPDGRIMYPEIPRASISAGMDGGPTAVQWCFSGSLENVPNYCRAFAFAAAEKLMDQKAIELADTSDTVTYTPSSYGEDADE